MKFGHEFKEALIREGFPTEWVDSAIPYAQLKKVLKKVSSELQEIGLDPATLARFTSDPGRGDGRRGSEEGVVGYKYDFEGHQKDFRPKLKLFFEGDLAVNATLSPDTRAFLKNLVVKHESSSGDNAARSIPDSVEERALSGKPLATTYGPGVREVEINLTFDSEFFDLIQGNVTVLDRLQAEQQTVIATEIVELSKELTSITQPPTRSKFRNKSDMYKWRELFNIYLQAEIFFSTREADSGSRRAAKAADQLDWFQSEVMRQGILTDFKLPGSRQALHRFVRINVALLRNIKYQELQQMALGKINKKFKKRTHLDASISDVLKLDPIMSDTMAKAVCAQVSQDLVKLVPQLDDYDCPICTEIAFRPIRLRCTHVLCIRCTVLLQRQRKGKCPICREDVVLLADTDSIDEELQAFQKKNFPEEVRQKRIEMETAYGIEQFGVHYKHPSESKCAIM